MAFKTLQNFEDIYITSDLHLSHRLNRTIRDRNFTDPEEHTKFIRNLINSTIKNKNAILYVVGDVGYKDEPDSLIEFLKSITPRVKVAIGNHDSAKQLNKIWRMGLLADCKHDYKIRWNNNLFHINHLPLLEWEGYYLDGYHCFGHTHGNMKPYHRAMDIGLDANDMKIVNLSDVVTMRQNFHNIDENKNSIKLF